MTIDNPQVTNPPEQKSAPFGTRLKDAREAMGLEQKDAAAQLRLNEKVIVMLERERYPVDLPPTFIRGYIRAYAKLLQIPEHEIRKAIEPIKERASSIENPIIRPTVAIAEPVSTTGDNYFLQLLSYVIFFALIGGAGWYYTHNMMPTSGTTPSINSNPSAATTLTAPIPPPVSEKTAPTTTQTLTPATNISKPEKQPAASTSAQPVDSQNNFSKANGAPIGQSDEDNDAPKGSTGDNNNTETISDDAE